MSSFNSEDSQTVNVAGHQLTCPVCSGQHFWTKRAQLNTAIASFFNLDWANHTATCFVCSECSHIMWFHEEI